METTTANIDKLKGLLNEVLEKKSQNLQSDFDQKLNELKNEIKTISKRPKIEESQKSLKSIIKEQLEAKAESLNHFVNKNIRSFSMEVKAGESVFLTNPSREVYPQIVPLARRQSHIRDIFVLGNTSQAMIQVPHEKTSTGAPAMQTPTQPKALLTKEFDLHNYPVETLAAVIKLVKSNLDDMEYLSTYLATHLPNELLAAEDHQLVNGNGTSPNLHGISFTAGSNQTNTSIGNPLPNPQIWDVIARVMGGMLAKNEPVDFVLLNPVDYAAMLTAKGNDGQYVSPILFQGGQVFVYGLPVYVSSVVMINNIIMGNSMMAQPVIRQGLTIDFSYDDADNFQRNLVTVRAEERLANVIYRKTAFFVGDINQIIDSLTP